MEQGIKFTITGDTKGLEQATKKAKKEVDGLGDATEGASQKVETGAESIEGLGDASKKAGNDAKSLSSQLTSMAVNVASVTAITTLAIELFTQLETDTGFLTEAITGMSRADIKAAEARKALNEAVSESVAKAQTEIFTLETLLDIARDETRTKQERENAINRINTEYPTLLGNLDLERIATNDVDIAVKSLSQSLIRQAKIKALTDQLTDAQSELNKVLRDSGNDAATFSDKLAAGIATGLGLWGDFSAEVEELGNLTRAADFFALEDEIAKIEKQIKDITAEENFNIQVPPPNFKELEAERKRLLKQQEAEEKRQADILSRINAQLFKDEQEDAIKTSQETASEITEIYRLSGGQALDLGISEAIKKEADETEAPILKLETSLKSLQSTLKAFDLQDIDLTGLSTSQLDALGAKLEQVSNQSEIFGSAIQAAFSGAATEISSALQTGNAIIDGFVSSIIQSLATLGAAYLANELFGRALAQKLILTEQAKSNANAITIASSAAAAAGPAGIFALPGLLAATLAQINGAFAGVQAIGAFAQGGIVGGGSFTGDQILARLNSGERILTLQDQSLLTRFLRGETMGSTNQTGGMPTLEASAVIRGSDIYLAWNRAERNNKRYFGR